ncbi:MAG: cell division protein FtsQ [Bacteroidaceae bacterium]|nr:cell division protein FtsQ [Bacteroidaceae bacterium]
MQRSTIKTIAKVIALLGMAIYFILAVTLFNHKSDKAVCTGLDIFINDPFQTGFVTDSEVRAMLIKEKEYPEGQALENISLAHLERVLRSNPYIDVAQCHYTPEGHIVMMLTPRIPVLHVLDNSGRDYYLDNKGHVMPRGYHTSNLIVLTGHVDSLQAGPLYTPLALKLNTDSFWTSQVQEIHINNKGDIELTPRVGAHIIELGDTSNIDDKLERMRIFYREGISRTGWEKYSRISLKYDGQVVCTKH